MSVGRRHSKNSPCPICGGHPDMQRGQGIRCAGWVSSDGKWAHCQREDGGGRARFHSGSDTYSHAMTGRCPCGEQHGPDSESWSPPPVRAQQRRSAEVRQIGDTDRAPIVATYPYHDRTGKLLYEVCRTEPKSFRQRRPDGKGGWIWNMQGQKTTLYRIPELWAALPAGDTIYIVEGEKDVESLRALSLVATCNTGGAGKWRPELGGIFKNAQPGSRIVIIQDRDEPGREHARAVYASLCEQAADGVEISIVEARDGKDVTDHLAAGRGIDDLDQVWPIADDLLERDPGAFKRHMLRKALERPEEVLSLVERDADYEELQRHQPLFHTGLIEAPFYPQWRGCIAISGEPSTGKSYVAISTAVDAALAGWDVFYLSAEMHQDLIRDRAARAMASSDIGQYDWTNRIARTEAIERAKRLELPDRWNHVDVGIGVTIEMLIELLSDLISHRPTMVVMDSLSSFVDNMSADGPKGDTFGMTALRHITRWIVGARKMTHGHLAFLLLSELNKEGRAKGRFLDHRCDTAIAMKSDGDRPHLKSVAITKNWWGRTGSLGMFVLDWELGRLRHVDEDGPDEALASGGRGRQSAW